MLIEARVLRRLVDGVPSLLLIAALVTVTVETKLEKRVDTYREKKFTRKAWGIQNEHGREGERQKERKSAVVQRIE